MRLEQNNYGPTPYRRYNYVVGMIKAEGQGKWKEGLLEFKEKEKLKNIK